MRIRLRVNSVDDQSVPSEAFKEGCIIRYGRVEQVAGLSWIGAVRPMIDFWLAFTVDLRVTQLRDICAPVKLQSH